MARHSSSPSNPPNRPTHPPWRRGRRLGSSLPLALSGCLLTTGLPLAPLGLVTATALAATAAAARDLNADAKAAAAETIFNAAATLDAFKREADDRLRGQRRQIEALQTRVKTAEARRETAVATLRSELARAQEGFVAELAARDRAYAREIAVFRRTVEDIAATPEGAEALRVYNAGEEVKALGMLRRLADARRQARELRNNIETAADYRKEAMLARDARNKGKLTTRDVIAKFEEVTQLDPGVHWDWVELSQLYTNAGQLDKAKAAALRSADTASGDRDRSVALIALGDVLVAQGDHVGARASFQDSLAIRVHLATADPSPGRMRDFSLGLEKLGDVLFSEGDLAGAREPFQDGLDIAQRLATVDPTSTVLQRDLSVALDKLGDLLMAANDLDGAQARFQESLDIRSRLATADPSSASMQHDISASMDRLGDVRFAQGDLAGARARFQDSLDIRKRLAAADPSSASLQISVSVVLNKMGDVLMRQRNFADAQARFQEGLTIAQRLAAADPTSAKLQRDVSVSLAKVGGVLTALGNLPMAISHFQEGLAISRRLAAANPRSAELQRDIVVSLAKLTSFPGSGVRWQQVADQVDRMRQQGMLKPSDAWMADEAHRKAAAQDGASKQP